MARSDSEEGARPIPSGHPRGTQQLRAYCLIVVAAVLWGSLGVMAKMLYIIGMSPWSLIVIRTVLGFLGCGLVILLSDPSGFRVRWRDLPFMAVYGLVGTAAFFVLYLYTIDMTTVAVASVLLYTAPVFVAIIARFTFGESITSLKALALVLSFGGCVLVVGLQSGYAAVNPLGIATGLGAAVSYASFGIMGKHARQRYSSWTIIFYSTGFAALSLAPGLPNVSIGPYPAEAWVLVALIVVGPTIVARWLFVVAVKHVEASRAAIVNMITPVAAVIFAFLLIGEVLSPSQTLGGILVLVGATLAQLPAVRRK